MQSWTGSAPVTVLTEDKEPRGELMWRRLKRHGSMTLVGQIGFVFLQRFIAKRGRVRMAEIIQEQGLNPEPNRVCEIIPVGSVNSPACREALARLNPDVVIVIGTRSSRPKRSRPSGCP